MIWPSLWFLLLAVAAAFGGRRMLAQYEYGELAAQASRKLAVALAVVAA